MARRPSRRSVGLGEPAGPDAHPAIAAAAARSMTNIER
jgi:hypothetical protein